MLVSAGDMGDKKIMSAFRKRNGRASNQMRSIREGHKLPSNFTVREGGSIEPSSVSPGPSSLNQSTQRVVPRVIWTYVGPTTPLNSPRAVAHVSRPTTISTRSSSRQLGTREHRDSQSSQTYQGGSQHGQGLRSGQSSRRSNPPSLSDSTSSESSIDASIWRIGTAANEREDELRRYHEEFIRQAMLADPECIRGPPHVIGHFRELLRTGPRATGPVDLLPVQPLDNGLDEVEPMDVD